jgi:hypothetical protein
VHTSEPLPTDGRPEPARRLRLDVVYENTAYAADADADRVCAAFVTSALDEYRKHVFGEHDEDDAAGGVAYWCWDDQSCCWSKAKSKRRRPFDTLHLPPEASRLVADFEMFCAPESVARYRELHVAPTRVYMLHGRPGSGKSSLIHCLASQLGLGVATLAFEPGFTDADVRLALSTVPPRCMVRVEDVDCLFDERRRTVGPASMGITFAGLLAALDDCSPPGGGHLGIFLTTNRLCALDAALRRRIDYVLEFGWATRGQARAMVARYFPEASAAGQFEAFWKGVAGARFPMSALQKFLLKTLQQGPPCSPPCPPVCAPPCPPPCPSSCPPPCPPKSDGLFASPEAFLAMLAACPPGDDELHGLPGLPGRDASSMFC